jgi:FHS family L-fucose permease-like MFS transporter
VYVGVEVAVGSNLGELLKQNNFGGLSASQISPYISMYWGSLMIGRWTGAIGAFAFEEKTKKLLRFVMPLVAFLVILLVNTIAQKDMTNLYGYIACVLIQIAAYMYCKDKPTTTLLVFGVLGMLFTAVGLLATGTVAVYAFLACGLCCSIMWPCIFSLSVAGLGKYTTQGSAFLIMMILGGGIIPPIQGKLADIIGIHHSFVVPLICFAYIALFAYIVKGILHKQGISYDEGSSSNGH